jgi:hypothetical protein
MLCPSCNKFAAYDTSIDPELDLEVGDDGVVTGTSRIVLASSGQRMLRRRTQGGHLRCGA